MVLSTADSRIKQQIKIRQATILHVVSKYKVFLLMFNDLQAPARRTEELYLKLTGRLSGLYKYFLLIDRRMNSLTIKKRIKYL